MKKHTSIYILFLPFIFCLFAKGQAKTDFPEDNITAGNIHVKTSRGPSSITRTIKQDRKGNIWIASWEGIIRYDGKWFTNITKKPSASAIYDFSSIGKYRFFSILEDRKGIMWFGSIGGGVFVYDGTSFQNFTIKEGLLNDDVNSIYEDTKGNVWFGVSGGASRYDGKSFQNYIIKGDSMKEDHTGITFLARPPFEVTSIIEDKTGKFWFATRGNTFMYDGKTFTVFRKEDGKPFTNVRCIMEDSKGNIWLGGNDGLWCYNGNTLINFTLNFTGYIYEDKKGNIWTSSENDKGNFYTKISGKKGWMLSRYNENSLNDSAVLPDIIRANEGMIFGITEASDGSIWYGTFVGVYRYDGNTISEFIN